MINNGADPEIFKLLPKNEVDAEYSELRPNGARWFITVGTCLE